VRASSAEALKKFDDMTLSEILQVPHHIYTHIIHVPRDLLQMEFGWKNLVDVEKVGRMTPEPAAFVYEYVHEDQDGKAWGEFSFCWPDEIEKETNYIMAEVEGLLGQPTFLPIFYLPKELVGAPTHFEFKEDDEFNFGDEEDGI
jgi:hypothetical protein